MSEWQAGSARVRTFPSVRWSEDSFMPYHTLRQAIPFHIR